jgi:hypothetical protein
VKQNGGICNFVKFGKFDHRHRLVGKLFDEIKAYLRPESLANTLDFAVVVAVQYGNRPFLFNIRVVFVLCHGFTFTKVVLSVLSGTERLSPFQNSTNSVEKSQAICRYRLSNRQLFDVKGCYLFFAPRYLFLP